MRNALLTLAVSAAVALTAARDATAQTADAAGETERRINGWSVTPSLGYAGVFDDNALVRGTSDLLPKDFTNAINPRLGVDYNSGRSEFGASYDGTFVAYRELTSLNSFDWRASVSGQRLVTRRVTWSARGSAAESPTTELLGLVGVPYVRIGSRLVDGRSGVEAALTRRLTLSASYGYQWVDFDPDPILGIEMLGGTSHGAFGSIRYTKTPRVTMVGLYDLQFAEVIDGGRFAIQNGQGGVELTVSESLKLRGTAGISRLRYTELDAGPRTGPAFQAGITYRVRQSALDVSYSRAFVPTFGFAGTSENEELAARAVAPVARRAYVRGGFAWRRNEPLVRDELKLTSIAFDSGLGYLVQPWMRIEGFFDAIRQDIDRPGGQLSRNRIGVQVVTAKPMRIR
jgi:hypothetical protein